ncbi:cupin domain-containing protein [Mesorhizobium delmotii]
MPGCHSKDGSVPHWHDNEQILVMVSGMCKLTIDGKIFDAHPGDLLFFPAGPAIARSARDRKAASITKSSRPPVRTNCRVGSDHRSCATTES